jgi:hypothetical protein
MILFKTFKYHNYESKSLNYLLSIIGKNSLRIRHIIIKILNMEGTDKH